LSGASALSEARDLMSPSADRVDGYCTSRERDQLVRECFLAPDPQGSVTLRVADLSQVAAWSGAMPVAVVGVDLAESADPRERDAGRRILEGLLPWRASASRS
jgi:hypothetical protein